MQSPEQHRASSKSYYERNKERVSLKNKIYYRENNRKQYDRDRYMANRTSTLPSKAMREDKIKQIEIKRHQLNIKETIKDALSINHLFQLNVVHKCYENYI